MLSFYKKIVFFVFVFSLPIYAKKFDFIEEDFEQFVQKIVATQEVQEPFKSYYSALSDSLQHGAEQKRKSTYRYLVRLGMTNLRTAHPDWYNAIEPYMTEEEKAQNTVYEAERVKITMFLIRYGAYEEFKSLDTTHKKAQVFAVKTKQPESEKNWWQQVKLNVKSFATSAYNKMTDLFAKGTGSASLAA